ncbi:MAG TPA: hypothetical protein VJO53_14655 [Candidatus Acidoferrales bacterium]|nr:hypothetical protein [Candidatus Acidoferrales bacterium]
MRRILIARVGISLATAALAALAAGAQALPSKKEAVELVEKAEAKMQLTGPGAAPFHLLAKIHYKVGNAALDGGYELLWASEDHYREEFRLGTLSSTYLALGDKLYIQRNTPTLTYPQWRVRALVGFPGVPPDSFNAEAKEVYESHNATGDVLCVLLKAPKQGHTECFAPATGEIVSSEYNGQALKALNISLSRDSFMNVGDARFPGHTLSTIGEESLELHVDLLEGVGRFADTAFVPPAGASVHDWCARPKVEKQVEEPQVVEAWVLNVPNFRSAPTRPDATALYVEVRPDGLVKKVAVTYPDGSAKDYPTKAIFSPRLSIHICAGKRIEYEMIAGSAIPVDPERWPRPAALLVKPPN